MSEDTNYLSELTGVFGYPVAENPTIVMQEAAFSAKGLNWRYLNIEVKPEDLPDAMRGLKAMNFRGINLTIPHKVAVLEHLDEIAPDAALIGAVNTVRRDGKRLIGENTDGKGFLMALRQNAEIDPVGKKVVILGAGGAARAISVELALAGAGEITIVNRTEQRGQTLVDHLNAKTSTPADFVHWTAEYGIPSETDILINSTSIGLYPDVDAWPDIDYNTIHDGMLVCDVIPNPPNTPFLQLANGKGAQTLDGLGMLVYQGAIGFTMWTGEEAPVAVMYKALSDAFA
jgi:shikimate dehydrogenase